MRSLLAPMVLTAVLTGCFMDKRFDAVDAVAPDRLRTVRQFAKQLEPQSSISRSSGRATELRLGTLFPKASRASNGPLYTGDFAFEGAQGLDRAFGQGSRPYESLAQVALRSKVATLCKGSLATKDSTVFELVKGKQLLDGETAPADAVDALALAAARNIWLHPYLVTDAPVRELASLYKDVRDSGETEGGETGAKRAMCEAALLANQFWIGTPESTDPARRLALEVFKQIPAMKDLSDYAEGKLTIAAYFDRMMTDPQAHEGMITNVNQWHEEWLGLREFFASPNAGTDFRGFAVDHSTGGPGGLRLINDWVGINLPISGVASNISTMVPGAAMPEFTGCETTAAQTFVPETDFVLYDHSNFESGARDFSGAWVRDETASMARFRAAVKAEYWTGSNGDALIDEACRLKSGQTSDTLLDQFDRTWRRCTGFTTLHAGLGTDGKPMSGEGAALALEKLRGRIEDINLALASGTRPPGTTINLICGPTLSVAQCNVAPALRLESYRTSYSNDIKQLVLRLKRLTNAGLQVHAFQTALVATTPPDLKTLASGNDVHTQLTAFIADLRTAGSYYYESPLAVMTRPVSNGANPPKYYYLRGGMATFSLSLAEADNYRLPIHLFSQSDRRVRRFAPSGSGAGGASPGYQNGWSTVKLAFSGREVSVCNNTHRYMASCFMRPRADRTTPIGNVDNYVAGSANVVWVNSETGQTASEGFTSPQVITSMRCGEPQVNAIRNNLVVTNPHLDTQFFPTPTAANPSVPLNNYGAGIAFAGGAGVAGSSTAEEKAIFQELYSQIRHEPYALIDHLIDEDGDYRELLTANYTYGNGCLKRYYSTQGYFLPHRPERSDLACSAGLPASKFTLNADDDSIPANLIAYAGGGIIGQNTAKLRMWTKLQTGSFTGKFDRSKWVMPPKLLSGILTMPGFVAPVSNTARGISARYFARLLCDMPSFYDPAADGATALHQSFISSRKHLRSECYLCHRNMDPLASALSWSFLGLLTPVGTSGESVNSSGGEGGSEDYLGELTSFTVNRFTNMIGTRHGGGAPGPGAFLGKPVSGIAGLGTALSNSTKFSQCVVSTFFQYIYGRPVQFADVKYFNELVDNFRDKSKSNYRFKALIKTMVTNENYRRKN